MKPLAALAALTVALAATVVPALARDGYVVDDAHLLSANAVARIDQQVADFHAQSGKEVVFVSTPSLAGQTVQTAAERAFAQNQVNGVMIFVAKAEHRIGVVPDRAASSFFPPGSTDTIRQAMAAQYKTGDYDGGTVTGVNLVINMYRSHLGSRVRQPAYQQPVGGYSNVSRSSAGGFSMGWIWWIIILAVIFFVIRGIFRAMAGPRMMPPGYGGGPMGGPGYGGGYGGGFGGGGGGFFSGLLGGLGGAFLGNELFGNRGGGFVGGNQAGFGGDVAGGNVADTSGFQSDAGQADMGNASFGDYGGGDSGGWGGGGGGGDWGGGGDSGGGGGGDW